MRKQKPPITGDYTLQPADDDHSLFLTGNTAQTITGPDTSGAAAATVGFVIRIYNRGAQDATFSPQSPQQPSHTIAASAAATLDLGPGGIWSRS